MENALYLQKVLMVRFPFDFSNRFHWLVSRLHLAVLCVCERPRLEELRFEAKRTKKMNNFVDFTSKSFIRTCR